MTMRVQNIPFPKFEGDAGIWSDRVALWAERLQRDLVEDIKVTTEVWEELQIAAQNARFPGVSPAGLIDYQTGVVVDFTKAADTEYQIEAQMPHAYKQGSDLEFHLHACTPSEVSGVAYFDVSYTWVNINGDITGSTGFTKTITIGSDSAVDDFTKAADKHWMFHLGDLTGLGKKISSVILATVKRNGNNAADTLNDSVYVLTSDFHYIRDTGGSRERTTK